MRYCPHCFSAYKAAIDHCGIDGTLLVEGRGDPLVGRSVDRYEVLERVGQGAMGCVYRVRHAVLEHEHAMKVLFGDLSTDRRLLERFRREAKAVSRISHPHVVGVSDFGTSANGLTFLVMEYVAGRTLAHIIADEAPLAPARAGRLARQIAVGLAEAHRLELVHRDIKPANIMVQVDDGHEYVKILDFGVVGIRYTPRAEKITGDDQFVGTPLYMAPEQALDPTLVQGTADLYSLGVVLFEMLTGKPPFDGNAVVETIVQHTLNPPPQLPPSGGLEMLVLWLLEKDPTKRPQSAADVIAELDRLSASAAKEAPSNAYVDTVEMYIDESNLGEARGALERALASGDPASQDSIRFEPPITLPPPGSEAATLPQPAGSVGYEGLRARLERMLSQIAAARADSDPAKLEEIMDRFEQMKVAVRPGLHNYRYTDLAAKIAKLEDDLASP